MKNMSLKNRILLYFLIVPFCVFVTAGFLTIIDMYKLQDFATVTGGNITKEAAQECSHAMHKKIHAQLLMLADGQATICQVQMQRSLFRNEGFNYSL